MMPRKGSKSWVEARALVQRGGKEHLIVRPSAADSPWEFPGGRIGGRESPEAGLRRLCRELLASGIEIHVGQPPFVYSFGTHSVTYRYYVCAVQSADPAPPGYAEARWVLTQQLREYVFDAPTQQVVDWLVEDA